jgi:hypothetical protein
MYVAVILFKGKGKVFLVSLNTTASRRGGVRMKLHAFISSALHGSEFNWWGGAASTKQAED